MWHWRIIYQRQNGRLVFYISDESFDTQDEALTNLVAHEHDINIKVQRDRGVILEQEIVYCAD